MIVDVVLIAGADAPADDPGIARARALRHAVFVDGLDYTVAEEFDDLDWQPGVIHVLAHPPGEPDRALGTARLVHRPERPGVVRVTRVGVASVARGRGVGRALMEAAEAHALATFGVGDPPTVRVELSAMAPAVPFYEALGYAVDPESYLEVRRPHHRAVKLLGRS